LHSSIRIALPDFWHHLRQQGGGNIISVNFPASQEIFFSEVYPNSGVDLGESLCSLAGSGNIVGVNLPPTQEVLIFKVYFYGGVDLGESQCA